MRLVELTCAMKTSDPFVVVGDKGDRLRLTHGAAQFVVNGGNGVYADGGEKPGPTRAELEALEAKEAEVVGTLKKVGEYEVTSEVEEAKRPYGNAPKSAWVRYACAIDEKMTTERAEGMTKADLMSRYGERL